MTKELTTLQKTRLLQRYIKYGYEVALKSAEQFEEEFVTQRKNKTIEELLLEYKILKNYNYG